MYIAICDENDELFAYLTTSAARRRGHVARQYPELASLREAMASPPSAVVIGTGRINDLVLAMIVELRAEDPGVLIYLVAENTGSRATIAALEAGTTEVVMKPVLPLEVLLRVEQALPSRGPGTRLDGSITAGDIEVDLDRIRASKAGHELILTRMEIRLLHCLVQHNGRVAPTERLLEFGWESEDAPTSTLKTHISHLRQKLAEAGGLPVEIRARQMLGYVLTIDDSVSRDGGNGATPGLISTKRYA